MAKRKQRVPRYMREYVAQHEAQARSGIPRDAIPADLSQQLPRNSCCPPLYYRDYEFRCRDCGEPQVWTAVQQKWWYEMAKGSIYSRASRCRACRIALRAKTRGTPRISHAERRRRETAPQ